MSGTIPWTGGLGLYEEREEEEKKRRKEAKCGSANN